MMYPLLFLVSLRWPEMEDAGLTEPDSAIWEAEWREN
jgi:hypothetical protein